MVGFIPQSQRGGKGKGPGKVQGPGTGTSDSVPDRVPEGTFIMPADSTQALGAPQLAGMGGQEVPVQLSNGEYKMPPEQVHAVGVQTLEQVKNATHTPQAARGFAPAVRQSQGGEPRQFFADGGVVFKDGREPGLGPSGQFAQVPNNIGQQPGRTPAPTGAASVSTGQSSTVQPPRGLPPAARAKAPAPASPTGMYFEEGMTQAGKQFDQGEVARGLGVGTRTALGAVGMAANEALDNTVGPVARGLRSFAGGMMGGTSVMPTSTAATAAPSPAAATAQVPGGVSPVANPTDQRLASGVQAAPAAAVSTTTTPAATPPITAASPAATAQGLPSGVYSHGLGQYSDQASGMEFGPAVRNGGVVSAQNMQAADNLAGRQEQAALASGARGFDPTFQVPTMRAPQVRHSGNNWEAAKRLRELEGDAKSITNQERWGGEGAKSAASQAYQAAINADLQARGMAPAMEQAAMRENAAIQRQVVQEQGADRRDARRGALDQQRLGLDGTRLAIDAQRLNSDNQVRGFQVRSAERMEQMQQAYQNAKTHEERAQVAAQIRGISGKDEPADWAVHVTPGVKNADGSTTEASVYRYNKSGGQVEKVGGPQGKQGNVAPPDLATPASRPIGTKSTVGGKTAVWDGKQWMPSA